MYSLWTVSVQYWCIRFCVIEIQSDRQRCTSRSYNSRDVYNTLLLVHTYDRLIIYVGQLYASLPRYMHEITNFVPSWKSNKTQRLHLAIFAIQMSCSLAGRNHKLHLQNNMSSDKVKLLLVISATLAW